MRKIKQFLIIGTVMLIAVDFYPLIGAEQLEGSIDVDVRDYIGVVCPKINIENQNISFAVENISDDKTTYMVNDTLEITLTVNDTSGRSSFILPRSVFYSVFITRDVSDAGLFPIFGIFRRLMPVKCLFRSINVVNSTLGGKKNSTIVIPVQYTLPKGNISNENLTLYIIVTGFLPGNVNGFHNFPIVAYKKITLAVTYIY